MLSYEDFNKGNDYIKFGFIKTEDLSKLPRQIQCLNSDIYKVNTDYHLKHCGYAQNGLDLFFRFIYVNI